MMIRRLVPFLFVLLFAFSIEAIGKNGLVKYDFGVRFTPNKSNIKEDTTVKKKLPATAEKSNKEKWNTNAADAKIKFSVKGPFGTVHGTFGGFKSTIFFNEDNPGVSSFDATVDVKTINTGISLRNHDLQKEKYFDSDKYPELRFRSDKIEKSGSGYKAIGNLTIKDVTKPVEIPFSFSEKGNSGIFKGSFTIQRQDYHIGKAGGSIGESVAIDLEVPVTR